MKLATINIFETSSDAIFVISLDGIVLDCNKGVERIYGYNSQQIIGQHFSLLLPAERKGELDRIIGTVLSAKSIEPFESERITIENTLVKVSSGFSPLMDAFGNITGLSCIERKLVNLESIAYKAQQLLETAPDAMVIVSAVGKIVFANRQTEQLFGFSKDELQGQEVEMLIPGRYACQHRNQVKDFVENQRSRSLGHGMELFGKRKDGSEFPAEISLSPVNTSEGVFISAAIRDVTERKLSERKVKALLQSTREGIYLYDTDLRLILMNEQGQRFAEMRSGARPVIGQHVSEFTRQDEIKSVLKILQDVLQGQDCDIERNIPSEDGSLWLHLTYSPVKENDSITGVCIIARDVTELVHSRENLVTARQRAEQSEHLQEQFLANMSHEIRTPLNGIVGMSNLLLNTPLNDQQKDFLNNILRSSDNLLFLINDILDLSKIKAGKFRIEKIPMDVYDVIEEVIAPFKLKAREKGIRLSVMMDPSIPRGIMGDPHRLVQVLNNLLSNAIKFTNNGVIKLEVELEEKSAGKVLLNFIVSDSGIGIDEQLLDHIFESFAQESSDTARRFGGTGLGLAITKRLVELQGGYITVQSTKGEGSRFKVSIPYELSGEQRINVKEQLIAPPVNNDKPDFKGKRVLVAEDNEVNQQVIRHLLTDYGLEVTLATDGKKAIDMLQADPSFDLILLDLRMPVMDGFQALSWIRQKLKLATPIIILTASVLRDERDRCIEMGANDYQAKPFSRPVLLQCLQRFL